MIKLNLKIKKFRDSNRAVLSKPKVFVVKQEDFEDIAKKLYFTEFIKNIRIFVNEEERKLFFYGEDSQYIIPQDKILYSFSLYPGEKNVFIKSCYLFIPELKPEFIFKNLKRIYADRYYFIDFTTEGKISIMIVKKSAFIPFEELEYPVFSNPAFPEVIDPQSDFDFVFKSYVYIPVKGSKKEKSILKEGKELRVKKEEVLFKKEKSAKKKKPQEKKKADTIIKKYEGIERKGELDYEKRAVKEEEQFNEPEISAFIEGNPNTWLKLFQKYSALNKTDACICLINALWLNRSLYRTILEDKKLKKLVEDVCPYLLNLTSFENNGKKSEILKNKKLRWLKVYFSSLERYDYFWAVEKKNSMLIRSKDIELVEGIDLPLFLKNLSVKSLKGFFEKRVVNKQTYFAQLEKELNEELEKIEKSHRIKKEKLFLKNFASKREKNKKSEKLGFDYNRFISNPAEPFHINLNLFKERFKELISTQDDIYKIIKFIDKKFSETLEFFISNKSFFSKNDYLNYLGFLHTLIEKANMRGSLKFKYFLMEHISNLDVNYYDKKRVLQIFDLLEEKISKLNELFFEDYVLLILLLKKRFEGGRSSNWFIKENKKIIRKIFRKFPKSSPEKWDPSLFVDLRDVLMMILSVLNDVSYRERGALVMDVKKSLKKIIEANFVPWITGEIIYNLIEYLGDINITPKTFIEYIYRIERVNIMAGMNYDLMKLREKEFILRL